MSESERVGYSILVNGEPKGIVPIPLSHARERLPSYERDPKYAGAKIEIVPVYFGMPVPNREPLPPPVLELA